MSAPLAAVALGVAVFGPWVAALVIWWLGEERHRARFVVGVGLSSLTSVACIIVAIAARFGPRVELRAPLLGTHLSVAPDLLGSLFAVVASVLWLASTVYATGYLSHGGDRARFFAFFAVCIGSAVGVALSGNLLTLFVFYEALTLGTYPLVVHSGTSAAAKGGRTYLAYALSGGLALAAGVIGLYAIGGGADFGSGGMPRSLIASHAPGLVTLFALLMLGFGVKAAVAPMHGWLPAAMVAPAPVSALLHAVAVVKAGVFGIARVVLDVYGMEAARDLGVLTPLAVVAAFTIVFASVRALAFDDIKKRLAYSTIGQLSYIVLGLALGSPLAAAAAVAHLAHHALLKITMFFTAGVLAEELGVKRVSEMDGVGPRLPMTMTAFTIAAVGIIGVPPMAAFTSKWGLSLGALDAGMLWPVFVLGISTALNAAYLLPMVVRAWFGVPRPEWGTGRGGRSTAEANPLMVAPLVTTAIAGLAAGLLAGAHWAPAGWASMTLGLPSNALSPWTRTALSIDDPGSLFLALALVCWTAVVIGSMRVVRTDAARYTVFLGLSAMSSALLAFARDAGFFYACFSVMALSAYGLIAHERSAAARSAGRTYLVYTVLAEVALLTGLVIASSAGGASYAEALLASEWRTVGIGALLIAFGTKIGWMWLGAWMPEAYRQTSPSAIVGMAGVVSSAGVLGMVRFLPGGEVDLRGWGVGLVVAGLGVAFYAVVTGVFQRNARRVLAFSSMSQFGLMTVGVGAGLARADGWYAMLPAVGLYLAHHGLAKAALFAGLGVAEEPRSRRWLPYALGVPALALAGLPLTSGAISKVALKSVTGTLAAPWAERLDALLPLAALGTTLLMARFIVLTMASRPATRGAGPGAVAVPVSAAGRGPLLAFILLLAATVALVPLWGGKTVAYASKGATGEYLWILSWPVLVGGAVALAFLWWNRSVPARVAKVLETWGLMPGAADAIAGWGERLRPPEGSDGRRPVTSVVGQVPYQRGWQLLAEAEQGLTGWRVAAGILAGLAVMALALAG